MKNLNLKVIRRAAGSLALVGASLAASSAKAAIDITADVTAAKADIATNGALVLGVVVAIAAIAWVRRVLH